MMEGNSKMLAEKHAVVTGGTRGIGAAITRALLAHGARVTMLGRSSAPGKDFAGEQHGEVAYVQADVCDPTALDPAFASAQKRFGPIGILVNNAGQARSAPFLKTDKELWRSMMQVNLDGAFHCTQAVLPGMLQAGWGRIINIASTARLIAHRHGTTHSSAKHDAIALPPALARAGPTKPV